jgi:tripartite-type tricarboxylate transporter receptor subunit TctC
MRKLLLAASTFLALVLGPAQAQEAYPHKPITLVTPFAVGGGSDILTRVLADALRKNLNQTVVVQNVVGAGGVVGSEFVAKATPDGYTLLLHHIGMATAPALYKDLRFDPMKNFEHIGLFADTPMVIVSGKDFGPNNFRELVEYAKKNKDKVTFASSGMGSATHLCAMLFEQNVGTKFTMIQYKGAAPALLDVQGGRVDLLCDVTAGITSQIQGGAVKAFVLTGDKRLESLPNLPTSAEAGMPGLNVTAWYGFYAPAGTPKPIIDRLSQALQSATQDPAVAAHLARMETTLFDAKLATPAAHRERLAAQINLWRPIIQEAQKSAGGVN